MAITKSFQTPNGATNTHHAVARISLYPTAEVVINHFLAAPGAGANPVINWQGTYPVDSSAISGPDFAASVEAWLISPAGPFAGGVIAGVTTPVQQLRAELIATAARRRKELRKIYTHDFGGEVGEVPFDADEASSSNILAIVAGPVLAGIQSPGPVEYKCADDVYRTVPFADFRTMAFALSGYVQGLHSRERELIGLVTAAGDDVAALTALAPVILSFLP